MKKDVEAFSKEKYLLLYSRIISDIRDIKYNIFPEIEEARPARPVLKKVRDIAEKSEQISVNEEKLKTVVSDLISHRFQSNLVKFKMLQQQEILRGLAAGGVSPEEAILILLDQTTGDELEEKVLSKGKISPQNLEELYKFYSRIGDNIDRLVQRKAVNDKSEKSHLFKEKT